MYPYALYLLSRITTFASGTVDSCDKSNSFFGLPRWYKYLTYRLNSLTGKCEVSIDGRWGHFWLIGLALLDILLHIAGMVAVAFVIWGGFTYLTSQGEPDKLAEARKTIINALVGAVIAVMAAATVGFIGNRLGG